MSYLRQFIRFAIPLLLFAPAIWACGGGSYPFDDSGMESGDLAQEFAEGRAMAEELEARAWFCT